MLATLRRMLASVLAWTVGAIAAISVGLLALSAIGRDMTGAGEQALSQDAVAKEIPAQPAAAATPHPIATTPRPRESEPAAPRGEPQPPARQAPPPAPGSHADRMISSPGGAVIARCVGSDAFLVSWSPAQGYQAQDVRRGPRYEARVRFVGPEDPVLLNIRCVNGVPEPRMGGEPEDK